MSGSVSLIDGHIDEVTTDKTCKDCIHYDVCAYWGNILDPIHGGVKCDDFKDKSRFVELQDECIIDYDQNKWLLLNLESRDLGEGIKRILDYAIKQS